MDGFITLRNLRLTLPLGLDAWGRPGKPQPVLISVRLRHKDIHPAAVADDCSKTTSYSDVAKAATKAHEGISDDHDDAIYQAHQQLLVQADAFQATEMTLETLCPKGSLRVEGGYGLRSVLKKTGEVSETIDIFKDLKLACIIGVNSHERLQKQSVVLNVQLWRLKVPSVVNWSKHRQTLISEIISTTERSEYETVEALALRLTEIVGRQQSWSQVVVHVEKPSAIALADGCGVEIHRDFGA